MRALVLMLGVLFAGPVEARPPGRVADALAHFQAGTDAYARGRFNEALAEFTAANQIKPDAVLLYDLAQTHRALGHDQDALRYYREYVEAAPYAPNRMETLGKIEVLAEIVERERAQKAEVEQVRRTATALTLDAHKVLEEARATRARPYPLHRKWWFWTLTGALVAGGVTTAVVLTRVGPPRTEQGNVSF
jgi:tetratricopeptide (TPR) repeat protein